MKIVTITAVVAVAVAFVVDVVAAAVVFDDGIVRPVRNGKIQLVL